MDKRYYEYSEMYNKSRMNTGYPEFKGHDSKIPDCISNDYCVREPRYRNDGILTMAFVDMQPLESVYPESTAFCNGSLFPNLNKPFFGGNIR